MPGVLQQEGTLSIDLCHRELNIYYYYCYFYIIRKLENKKHFLNMDCPQLAKAGRGGQCLRVLFVNKILQRKRLQQQKIQIRNLYEFTD